MKNIIYLCVLSILLSPLATYAQHSILEQQEIAAAELSNKMNGTTVQETNISSTSERSIMAQIVPTAGMVETLNVSHGDFFYDPSDGVNGGPGGDCSVTNSGDPGDYPNCGCTTTTTLTASGLSVTFLSFNVFGNFDYLNIYDGPNTSSPKIYDSNTNGTADTYAGMVTLVGNPPVFTASGGSLTFEFHATTVVNSCGWEAEISLAGGGTCAAPQNLVLDTMTATSAEFSWTASAHEINGYNWAVMANGEHPDNDIPVEDGSTATGVLTATATQLNHNTAYSTYVQTNCGTELSVWEGPLDFTTPIVPPGNDGCADAIMLTIGIDFDDQAIVGHNLGATVDSNDPIPTCDNFNFATNSRDVWYEVIVPVSGEVNVETRSNNDLGMDNTGMEIYSGTCGNLTLIECNTDDGIGDFSLIELTGRTSGETLLIRVWGYNSHQGEFLISAYGNPLPCDNPSNVTLVDIGETSAEFSWTASQTETQGYEWTVMADGENPDIDTPVETGTVGTGITSANANGLSPETSYDFYVRTNCGMDGMSAWEGPFAFTTDTSVGVVDFGINSIKIYPNPMGELIHITVQVDIEKVIIFNLIGQKLIEKQIGTLDAQIDVSGFASGSYLLYVTTSNGKVGVFNLVKN